MPRQTAFAGRRRRRRRARSGRLPAGTCAALLPLLAALLLAAGCRSERPHLPPGGVERGVASWYGEPFHGRTTASGEVYDMNLLTAAHRTLPFHTRLEVVNLDNGRHLVVRVNDRGPFVRGRILDLSYAAARELGVVGPGTARIELRVLGAAPPAGTVVTGTVAGGRYTVQVGAFADPGRADALRAELIRRYPATEVTSDGVWHRVRVGTYDRRPRAERVQKELRRLGFTALVVPLG
jgi:rare lipoprotein A